MSDEEDVIDDNISDEEEEEDEEDIEDDQEFDEEENDNDISKEDMLSPEDMEWNEDHHKVSTKLQAIQRGRTVRRERNEQSNSARKIQAIRRGRSERRELQEKKNAAVRIQASFRGGKTRKHHKHHKHHHKHHKQYDDDDDDHHHHHHHHHRTPRGRHDDYVPEEDYGDDHAQVATKLQSLQRGRKARERQKYHQERAEYEGVATKIQAAQRGRMARARNSERGKLHRQLHMNKKTDSSVNTPQQPQEDGNDELTALLGQIKGTIEDGNGNLEDKLMHSEKESEAAVKVQASARGYLTRTSEIPPAVQEQQRRTREEQLGRGVEGVEGVEGGAQQQQQQHDERHRIRRLLRGADSLPKYIARAFRHSLSVGLASDLDGLFDLLDARSEGSVSTEDLRASAVAALGLECTEDDLKAIPKAFGLDDENALFQYRDFVDFCRRHNLYNFDNSASATIATNRRALDNSAAVRRGGGGALMRDIAPSPRTKLGENSVTDYAEVVKYKQLVDDSTAQVESLTLQLSEREKDVRTLTDDVRQRERLNIRLQNENEIIRQETNALTTNRDRVQRELRRQVRLSQSLKQQVKQLEETMRGLERRVESQRRELKLNEQTMELMDQSRKLAEDQAYEAQRKTRHIEKEILKSPLRRSPSNEGYTSIRRMRSPTSNRGSPDPRTGLPRIGQQQQRASRPGNRYDRSGEVRSKPGGYDIHGRRVKRNTPSRNKATFQFDPNAVAVIDGSNGAMGGWNANSTQPRQPTQRTPGGSAPSQRQK
jgi:hypothetical protein